MPVKLGALCALLVVTVMLIAASSGEARRHAVLLTVLRLVSSVLAVPLTSAVPATEAAIALVQRILMMAT
ncbi:MULTISPECIES: hypothetical protein [unclassified Bradyrhizobium]